MSVATRQQPESDVFGWGRLRHEGLLLDEPRLRRIIEHEPEQPLPHYLEKELRRKIALLQDDELKPGEFAAFVLEAICGFTTGHGTWLRGSDVGEKWTRRGVTGEAIRPRHLWRGDFGAILPVFVDREPRLGVGRGARAVSQVLQWLRAGSERLAVLTNGQQWRLIFAGIDFDAWCQWDVDLWFEDGQQGAQLRVLRTLLQPALWTPARAGETPPLLQAVLDSRKGQSELSAALGERVREAVELLVQAHGEVLRTECADVDPGDIYRAAVRVVMRLVFILFAESREQLLPRENALYHGSYALAGLREELDRLAARGVARLKRSNNAWPRVLALFRLVYDGSHHPDLPVPEYGGELFRPGQATSDDGVSRALAVFESACFRHDLLFPDADVHRMLDLLTRTKVRIRQGRTSVPVSAPVDFSDLSSEYIGILYEGLLDFELKTAPQGDPIVFLAVGNQPALPLSRLEAMDDKALASLLEKMKDTSGGSDDEEAGEDGTVEEGDEIEDEAEDELEPDQEAGAQAQGEEEPGAIDDDRFIARTRAEEWARRAVRVGKLVNRPRGRLTPDKEREWQAAVEKKARQIVTKVVMPGEWYLVRWGGTRKGSGTFYTRPGLAVPTVHRTLRPLAYVPPTGPDGQPDTMAPPAKWTPRRPEEILALKVCDPACGSGTFPLAALRFLTDALYASLHHHGRISESNGRAVIRLFDAADGHPGESISSELLPCPPSDPSFETRLKAILRRHVVERCIYGVDIDPLAVELCRLALWIETMDRSLPFSFLDHKIRCGNSLVGAWFDTFQHYPVMAWKNREGGDRNHTNGVHFQKEARTKAIKAFVSEKLAPDLATFVRVTLGQNRQLFDEQQSSAHEVHRRALQALSTLHDLPVHAAAERARLYHEQVTGSPEYRTLRQAMDLWCACWFWPVDRLDVAPLPTTFAEPGEETLAVAQAIARKKRFFHWELEFPDVFNATRAGFDAIIGNPPWDIAKPNSKEFFSNIDPLYRSYGKQEAVARQTDYFQVPDDEEWWLDYNGDFKAQSNWVRYAAFPFGDPENADNSQDRFPIRGGTASIAAHEAWRAFRARSAGFADREHPFRHQGGADLNLYKLFLEQGHALLRQGGRFGFIVPSGIYSDHGTGDLRRLFLDRCEWEWLFGFENREKLFDIDSRFKFNPVIVQKGGRTRAIRTAFMRRRLEDWESAESLATPYTREQVERFSPRSKAILEIQSKRDLEILEKIYANSVLLGDDGPNGWGIRYTTEFHMTNDSRLFPPRPKWEEQGYRPDEYSRWLKGDWRPIDELWRELGVDPSRVVPLDPECARRIQAPDVQRTPWRIRCAQPPYDTLPIPRADIPPGIILSREGDAWIRQEAIEDIALPLYQGVMMSQLLASRARWIGGAGNVAKWEKYNTFLSEFGPQFLISQADAADRAPSSMVSRYLLRNIARSTDGRTLIGTPAPAFPAGHSLAAIGSDAGGLAIWNLGATLSSLPIDWQMRRRLVGTNISYAFLIELAVTPRAQSAGMARLALALACPHPCVAPAWMMLRRESPLALRQYWALTQARRAQLLPVVDCLAAARLGLQWQDIKKMLAECDRSKEDLADDAGGQLSPIGLWRVDKDKDPELRHTVLTLVAFADLEEKIRAAGGNREEGIEAFLNQNDGEGWMLPETLRLADYGLGHDERAKHPQPVASRLGPRYYDWQLAQTAEESWRECEVHAINLTGRQENWRQVDAPPRPTRRSQRNSLLDLVDSE